MTDARINIIADDNQVDALVQSMNNLQESLQSVIQSMNQTQTEARQTGNAVQGASRQTQAASNNIRQSANEGSTALAGMGSSAIRASGGLRGIAAASAAAAGPLVAAVLSVEALKGALTGTVTAITAYLEKSPQFTAQLNQLKQAGSDLQTSFGGFAFELAGGTDLLETLIDVAETGVDIFESLSEQVSGAGEAFTFSGLAIDIFRRSVAAVYSLIVAASTATATLANTLQLLTDLDFSRFQERQREIGRTFREQSLEVYRLAEGLNEVRRTGDAGAIDINFNTVSGGSGGGGSVEEQIVESTVQSVDALIEANRAKLDETVAAIRDLYESGILGITPTKAELESLLGRVADAYLKQYGIISDRRETARGVVEQSLQEAMGIDPQVAQLREDLINSIRAESAARRGATAAEAQIAQNRAAIARNQATLGTPLPVVPEIGTLAPGLFVGAAAGGAGTAGVMTGTNIVGNAAFNAALRTTIAEQVGILGLRGAIGPIARGMVQGAAGNLLTPLGGFGIAAGAAGGAAQAYSSEVDRLNEAQNEQYAAMVRQQQAGALRGQLLNRNLELASAGTRLLTDATEEQARAAANSVGIVARLTATETRANELRTASEQGVRDYAQANADAGKLYLQELANRRSADREYFDFIQRSIQGTKEETIAFASAIAESDLEDSFRALGRWSSIGPQNATDLALAAGVQTTNLSFGFQPSLDLDGIRRFRDLSDSFPSVALHLKAINDQLTENERKWALANGGVGAYIKAIEDSKERTQDAFKTDAIDGFTSSIENIGSFLGQTLAQSFDDGLDGAERAKALLAGMLGDFLTTIGSTAIAQGAIIAFGDPAAGGLPNPARAAGLIAAGTAAVIAGSALSGVASNIQRSGQGAGAAAATPGATSSAQSTTNVFIENRFGNRFDARELDRSANETFSRAAQAGQ
jgi:hypothetical protein